jgi:hypothetical protein
MFREKCKTVHQIAQLYRHSKETDQRFDFTIYDRMRLAHKQMSFIGTFEKCIREKGTKLCERKIMWLTYHRRKSTTQHFITINTFIFS